MDLFLSFIVKNRDVSDHGNNKLKKELDIVTLILQQITKLIDGSLIISIIQDKVFAKLDIPLVRHQS